MYINKIIKKLFISMILLLTFSMSAIGKDAEIRWKEVKRSYGYIVVIKNAYNKIVLRRKTKNTYLSFSLPEGNYLCRISVLNKFNKVSVSTKWFKIKIKVSRTPYINNISNNEFNKTSTTGEFTIEGRNFQKGCKMSYIRDDEEIPYNQFKVLSSEKILVKINPSNLKIGYYNIKITNPGDEYATIDYAIYIGINPVFYSITPNKISRSNEILDLSIKGKNFFDNCYVKFEKDDKSYSTRRTTRVSDDHIKVTVNPSDMSQGEYDIVIYNSNKFFSRSKKSFSVTPAVKPVITWFTPLTIRKKSEPVKIKIKGRKIKKGARISLIKNNSVYRSINLEVISEHKATAILNADAMSSGKYSIQVINPGGTSSIYKRKLKIKKTYTMLGIFIGVAWGYNIMLPEWDTIFQGSFYGGNFYLGYEPPAFDRVPFIRNIGFEFYFDFLKYVYVSSSIDDTDNYMVMSPGFGLFYNNNFKLPVFFLIRVGAGFSYTMMEIMTSNAKISTTSIDPYVYCGFAVRYIFLKHGFIEIGPDYQFIDYMNKSMHQLKIYLRIGVAF